MPYVNIRITREGVVTPDHKRRLIQGSTRLLEEVLNKDPKTTHVVIDEVDTTMDDCTHMMAKLVIERPDLPQEYDEGVRALLSEAGKAAQSMLQGARAYFKDPHAVRDHVNRVNFHNNEATTIALRTGR